MSLSLYDQKLFEDTCKKIIAQERETNGIGTLKEKTMHAVLKNFYEPDKSYQEIKVDRFVADILRDNEIIEIQTRSFNAMRKKLSIFLEKYPVTIVYPIPHNKWLFWIDEKTGEISKKRKSPKTGTFFDAFIELYKISMFLSNPNLHICLVLVDVEEYRLLNGWNETRKKGSSRYDRIPVALHDELYIGGSTDYCMLLPDTLNENFTSKELAKAAKIPLRLAQTTLTVLKRAGAIKEVGKKERCILYQRCLTPSH